MYEAFFGFREPPFRVTPDPRFLYRNPCYEEATLALARGIDERKGLMILTGEVGTGKTTLLRHLLETIDASVRTVLLVHPTLPFDEIVGQIVRELGLPSDGATDDPMSRLRHFLHDYTLSLIHI